jgi:UDP-N-acetylmuramyl pentapeptide synthase
MNKPILWTADEVRNATGGSWFAATSPVGVYRRFTFPLHYLESDSIVLHVHGPGWPAKSIEGSGQRDLSVDDLIRRSRKYSNMLIITSQKPTMATEIPVLLVSSTYEALFALAAYQRARFNGRIVGITGTAGKSSTRDFLFALLSTKGETFASLGNWNTVEGLALNLANLPPKSDFAVIEISGGAIDGMRRRNAIEMVRHHDAIITSIGVNLTSRTPTAKHVAEVKSRLFSSLPPGGCAYFSAEVQEIDTLLAAAGKHKRRVIGVPGASTVAVQPLREELGTTHLRVSLQDYTAEVSTRIIGPGPLSNLALALQCALDLGAKPEMLLEKIAEITLARRKMELHTYATNDKKIYLINDCHNATLVSFSSALTYLGRVSDSYKNLILVLGKIVHIEGLEQHVYESLAREVRFCEPKNVILFGDSLEQLEHHLGLLKVNVLRAPKAKQVTRLVEKNVTDGTLVFLKGSHRGTEMRKVADLLQEHLGTCSV